MSPIDQGVVARKCKIIGERLARLRSIAPMSLEEYARDEFRKKGVEKMLQELVNAALDVNFHVLSESALPTPADSHGSFTALGEAGILPGDLCAALAPFAGLRNRLVHEYESLDDAKVLAAVVEAERVFPRYVQALLARFMEP